MKQYLKEEIAQMSPHRRLQFLLLLIVCGAEALFIVTEGLYHYVGYYLIENYIVVPCLLFLGVTLSHQKTRAAKQCLWLSALMVFWFVLAQIQHKTQGMNGFPAGFFLLSYFMAFPFASAAEDGRKNHGFRILSLLMLTASMILVGYSLLLILDCLPNALEALVYWDGTRLHPIWHSNTVACLFMIGIGTGLMGLLQVKNRVGRLTLLVLITLQFAALALTNCRTSILMTCGLLGSGVFFVINRGGWKRFLAAGAAAVATIAVLFLISGSIYDLNRQLHVEKVKEQLQQSAAAEAADSAQHPNDSAQTAEKPSTQKIHVDSETSEITIQSHDSQGTLANDLKTLNGRTGIWRAVGQVLQDEKTVRLWGTEYGGMLLSYRNRFPVDHAHNSWMEILMCLGIPGLLLALVYTGIAVYSMAVLVFKRNVELWKKVAAVLMLCILAAGFLEPYLFISRIYYHFIDFIFFMYLGYLDQWRRQSLEK